MDSGSLLSSRSFYITNVIREKFATRRLVFYFIWYKLDLFFLFWLIMMLAEVWITLFYPKILYSYSIEVYMWLRYYLKIKYWFTNTEQLIKKVVNSEVQIQTNKWFQLFFISRFRLVFFFASWLNLIGTQSIFIYYNNVFIKYLHM